MPTQSKTVNAIKCALCEDVVWSHYRHDFRWCKCKECFIDGGRDYTRCGAKNMSNIIHGLLDTETGIFTPSSLSDPM